MEARSASSSRSVSIGEMPGEQNVYTIGDKLYLIPPRKILQWWPARFEPRIGHPGKPTRCGRRRSGGGRDDERVVHLRREPLLGAGGRSDLHFKTPIVELVVDTLVLSGNQVVGPRSDAMTAIEARVGGGTIKGDPAITALGNITAGRITVNGGPLQPPWEPLNIRTA